MATPRRRRSRSRWPTRSRTAASSAATSCCSKRWAADSPGERRCCAGECVETAIAAVARCRSTASSSPPICHEGVDHRAPSQYREKKQGDISPRAGLAMVGKTVTRADLCEAVYQKVGLSRTESSTLVELVLKEITDCLERGETVKLSSFGSFVVRKKGQRVGRNPKTGKEVPISPRRVMVFKPSAILKHRINSNGEDEQG